MLIINKLISKFGDNVDFVGKATPERTGFFEVQVVGGKLAWSELKSNNLEKNC